MKIDIRHIANVQTEQDGAIYGKYLFCFNSKGLCHVYNLEHIEENSSDAADLSPVSVFTLDKADIIVPHSNAVVFGNEFYSDGDEFPLLYSNVYNNYAGSEDDLCGVCCVYRLQRNNEEFTSTLVQMIKICFTDNREYWRSAGDVTDIRPYGNFVVDVQKSIFYAFVMRDSEKTTRYFAFNLPKVSDGAEDSRFGVKKVSLNIDDIKEYFDVPYHNYVQGACYYNGKIYSVEDFNHDVHPALRIIDPDQKKQIYHYDFCHSDMTIEAELIDFYNGKCYYGDNGNHLFEIKLTDEDGSSFI